MEGIFAASVVFDRLVIVYLDVSFSRQIVDGIEMKCVQKVLSLDRHEDACQNEECE